MEKYELSEEWQWKTLLNVLITLESGSRPKGGVSHILEGIPSLGGEQLNFSGGFNLHKMRYIPEDFFEKMPRGKLEKGDVLVVKDGATTGKVSFVSNDFPFEKAAVNEHVFILRANPLEVIQKYLFYYLYSPEGQAQIQQNFHGATIGGINKQFANQFMVPIPPIEEQHRIVKRIEEITRRVRDASDLQIEAHQATSALLPAALSTAVDSISNKRKPLADVLSVKPRNGWSPKCDDSPDGIPVLSLSAVTGFQYDGSKVKRTSEKIKKSAHYWLEPGDLLITRSNTLDLVGHAAIYDGKPYPCIYSDLMMRTRVNPKRADLRFVHFWFIGSEAREHIKRRAKGTSASMKKIGQKDVLEVPFPYIDLNEQHRIVGYLDSIRVKAEELKRQQKETHAEIDKVIPTVLSKAFRGEL